MVRFFRHNSNLFNANLIEEISEHEIYKQVEKDVKYFTISFSSGTRITIWEKDEENLKRDLFVFWLISGENHDDLIFEL